MNHPVNELVQAAQKGDKNAFSEIVILMQQQVFQYCYPMVANRHDAEDIVQETFIRAYEKLDQYKEEGRFIGWLLTIAHRTCLNKVKKKNRSYALMKKLESKEVIINESYEAEHGEALAILDTLKPKIRAVFILKFIHGMSYEEISAIVGLSPINLRKQVERAKKQLNKENSAVKVNEKRGIKYEY